MIGKLIGAGIGASLTKQTRKIGGPAGAILGAIAVPVLARMRLPTMLALAGGGYVIKKLTEKGDPDRPAAATTN